MLKNKKVKKLKIDGKKTYIVALLTLALAIFGMWKKVIDQSIGALLISNALMAMGLRSGINNVEIVIPKETE